MYNDNPVPEILEILSSKYWEIINNEPIKKKIKVWECDCSGDKILAYGYPTCTSCGLQGVSPIFVPELDLNSWKKQKSIHKRNKWFEKRIFGKVKYEYIQVLTNDFIAVVNKLMKNNYIKKNVSRYNFYIIRLASRRNIPLLEKINDMSEGKTKNLFSKNLFTIYNQLSWDIDCDCPYYLNYISV